VRGQVVDTPIYDDLLREFEEARTLAEQEEWPAGYRETVTAAALPTDEDVKGALLERVLDGLRRLDTGDTGRVSGEVRAPAPPVELTTRIPGSSLKALLGQSDGQDSDWFANGEPAVQWPA
jgi:hypothetical protein